MKHILMDDETEMIILIVSIKNKILYSHLAAMYLKNNKKIY